MSTGGDSYSGITLHSSTGERRRTLRWGIEALAGWRDRGHDHAHQMGTYGQEARNAAARPSIRVISAAVRAPVRAPMEANPAVWP